MGIRKEKGIKWKSEKNQKKEEKRREKVGYNEKEGKK
jgi:hypothetical protein